MTGLLSGSGLLAATLLTVGGSGAAVATAAGAAPTPLAQMLSSHVFLTPPTTADCEAPDRSGVLRAFQFQKAYNLGPLYKRGWTEPVRPIVIVDSYGFSGSDRS